MFDEARRWAKIDQRTILHGGTFMAISPELLEILRCPQCRSKVQIDAEETRLKCVNPECSLVYPIRDEIPVMLVEEATVEK